jgi:hypothetical protein
MICTTDWRMVSVVDEETLMWVFTVSIGCVTAATDPDTKVAHWTFSRKVGRRGSLQISCFTFSYMANLIALAGPTS